MELVDVSYKAPKELNDVRVALVAVIEDLKAGKDLLTVGAENLALLSTAVAGVGNLPAEVKAELKESSECIGHMVGEIAGVLLA